MKNKIYGKSSTFIAKCHNRYMGKLNFTAAWHC